MTNEEITNKLLETIPKDNLEFTTHPDDPTMEVWVIKYPQGNFMIDKVLAEFALTNMDMGKIEKLKKEIDNE